MTEQRGEEEKCAHLMCEGKRERQRNQHLDMQEKKKAPFSPKTSPATTIVNN